MSYILYFDVCAILITLVFASSIIIRDSYHGRANYLMLSVLIMVFIAASSDLGAALSQNGEPLKDGRLFAFYFFNDLYFLVHNQLLPIYVFFIYASSGIWHILKKSSFLKSIWTIVCSINIVLVIINHFYPVIYSHDLHGYYKRLPLISVFYISALFFGTWGIIAIFHYRKLMRLDKMMTLLFLYPVNIFSIIVQFFRPDIPCEMFAISISAMIFIIVIQNRDSLIDPIVGAERYGAGIEAMKNILITERPADILLIKITNNSSILMYLGQDMYTQFLGKLSKRLKEMARKTNFKGDLYYLEYGLYGFISDADSSSNVEDLAEEIKRYSRIKHQVNSLDIVMDTRICIISCPDDIREFQELFDFTTTFHQVMPNTRDVLKFSEFKDRSDFIIRRNLNGIMEQALTENRFQIFYQPIYSLAENRYVRAEALLRLYDERFGYISPKAFATLAESNGMVREISDFMMNEVFRFISENDMKDIGIENIQLNLSSVQCIEANLVDKIESLLDRFNVSPEMISFELTENATDIDPPIVDQNIRRLNHLGIQFALDDYGTGYSNIKRVTTLPFSQVKLDKSFVDAINDPDMWLVMQETIAMLKEMGKKVLVEGIEDETVASMFIDLDIDLMQGCEYKQGFHFCEPVPQNEFYSFMRDHYAL